MIAVILPLARRGQTLAIDRGGELADTFFFKVEITFPNKVILFYLMRIGAQNKTLDFSAANLLLKRQRGPKTEDLFLAPTLSLHLSEPQSSSWEVDSLLCDYEVL